VWGASPLWDTWNVVTKRGVVHFVNEDAEEGSSFFIRIGLEFRIDLDDKGRSNSGEQTSLLSELVRAYLSDARDSRISGWCSGPRRTSL